MFYAIDKDGTRIMAEPGKEAFCPTCKSKVIAKCGTIKVWHWAHESSEDCDSWAEPVTDWHLYWQRIINPFCTEVTLGSHRADVLTVADENLIVIELQHSSICPAEIMEREDHYSQYANMIWLFDASDFAERVILNHHLDAWEQEYYGFRWLHPRKSYEYVTKPMFWDMGDFIFRVKKLYTKRHFTGWGYALSHDQFIKQYLYHVLRDEASIGQKVTV